MRTIVALLFIAGCGSSTTGSDTYAAKCEVACRPPSGPCATADQMGCRRDCEIKTEGLATLCAQCLIDNSGWRCHDIPANPTCTAATGTCDGFQMPATNGSDCA